MSLTNVYGNFRQTCLLLLKKRKIFISFVTFFFFLISFSWKNCILAETTEGELDKKLFKGYYALLFMFNFKKMILWKTKNQKHPFKAV